MRRHHAVKRGAIAAIGLDYYNVGWQPGTLVVRILRGDKPGKIPSRSPRKQISTFNPTIAKEMGLTIPETLFRRQTGRPVAGMCARPYPNCFASVASNLSVHFVPPLRSRGDKQKSRLHQACEEPGASGQRMSGRGYSIACMLKSFRNFVFQFRNELTIFSDFAACCRRWNVSN